MLSNTYVAIAAIAVILAIYWMWRRRRDETAAAPASSPRSAPSSGLTDNTSGPTATGRKVTYSALPPAEVWSADKPWTLGCANTLSNGYCILPSSAQAEAACSADPKCVGYLQRAGGFGNSATAAQLTATLPVAAPGAGNASFFWKN